MLLVFRSDSGGRGSCRAVAFGSAGASPSHICAEDCMKKRVLFVCVENSNRSQMAQAFATMLGGDQVEAFSAGSRPSGRVNPNAIAAMKELGYDLTTHTSKGLEAFNGQPIDVAITMGCGDACPLVNAKQRFDWQIPDPREMSPDEFRKVRDLIRDKVQELLMDLGVLQS